VLAAWLVVLAVPAALLWTDQAAAEGTPACTDITTSAQVSYEIGAVRFAHETDATTITVLQLVDVSVVWQDAGSVTVSPGDSARVLTFVVTNTGNGADTFNLGSVVAYGGDDFDPLLAGIFLDTNGNAVFDPGADVPYMSGLNDPTLDPGDSVVAFLVGAIPTGLADGDVGLSGIFAASTIGTGIPGTTIPGAAACGVDAVVGTSGGEAQEAGAFIVSAVELSIVKSAEIADPLGGEDPVQGAVVTYAMVVTVEGSGTAEGVIITDSIPENTTYVPGTLTLDGEALTDEADGDAGDVGWTATDVVTVDLDDLAGETPAHTITFDVVIN